MVQAEQYQFPQRAPSMATLWDHLEKWQALGAEVEASGDECPEWMRAAAVLKLVPRELESQIVAKPELRSFAQRLGWIKAQLAHQRAVTQAAAISTNKDGVITAGLEDTSMDDPVIARLRALDQVFQKNKGKG